MKTLLIGSIVAISIGILGSLGYIGVKLFTTSRTITFEKPGGNFLGDVASATWKLFGDREVLAGEEAGRINILLLGRAGETYPGKNLTDTVMIASIDTRERRAALLSLPRDLFAPIGESSSSAKLNALYQIGLNEGGNGVSLVAESVTRITGLPIHYSLVLDFDGFERVIDTIGGIHVDVPRDFYDPRYPGKNYSYETFEIKKGWQTLDGKTALKYVRERHNDPEGDFGRAKRQQQVLQAVRERVFSAGTYLNPLRIGELLDVLGESVRTDLTLEEIRSLVELSQTFDTRNVTTTVADAWKKDSLLRVSHLQTESGAAFILVPRSGNWNELQALAEDIFDRDRLTKERAFIEKEAPSLTIVSSPDHRRYAEALRDIARDEFGFPNVDITIDRTSLDNPAEESTITGDPSVTPYSLQAFARRFGVRVVVTSVDNGGETGSLITLIIGNDIETSRLLEETGVIEETEGETSPLP